MRTFFDEGLLGTNILADERVVRSYGQSHAFDCVERSPAEVTLTSARCIFCKASSTSSVSVEHIIPESLGNQSNILPPGVVCDKCNNFFASKIEQPVLASGAFTSLRYWEAIPNKRKRFPTLDATVGDRRPAVLERDQLSRPHLTVPTDVFDDILQSSTYTLEITTNSEFPPPHLMSRFLAKCGLEVLAQKTISACAPLDYIIDESQLDAIRDHARRGQPREWPFHQRQIYRPDRTVLLRAKPAQVMHEYDILFTTPDRRGENGTMVSELFFVLCLFGKEFAINLGGPDFDGYIAWLESNEGRSPLYSGLNAGLFDSPPM